jgi:hypothetical protein
VKADDFSGPLCADPNVRGFFEIKNPCKVIGIKFKIFLPQNIRENYYLLKLRPDLKGPDVYEIEPAGPPILPQILYIDGRYYYGNYIKADIFINFIKKTDFEKFFGDNLYSSLTYEDEFGNEDCFVLPTSVSNKIWEEVSSKSEGEIDKYYKKRLKEIEKNVVTCNEFDKKLIKIKFAKPEDSDKSVLEELAKQLGVYNKDDYQSGDGYALGYIPQISPIELIEIDYKADPEVKDGYITLTKLRTIIYLDDGTKKEFEPSSLTTTSTNVITPTTSFQSIPTKPTSSQSLLLNLWFKIKCFFLRLIGKAC